MKSEHLDSDHDLELAKDKDQDQHGLYTDADVIFANRITQQDVQSLSKQMGQAIVFYGREYSKEK
jgi:hypothetical protein